MKRKQIIAGMLGFALLLSLCACTQPPVTEPEPTQTVTPSPTIPDPPASEPVQEPEPVETDTPKPVITPGTRQIAAMDVKAGVYLYVEEDGSLLLKFNGCSGPVEIGGAMINYFSPPADWLSTGPLSFSLSGKADDDGLSSVHMIIEDETSLLISATVFWNERTKLWSSYYPPAGAQDGPDVPDETILPLVPEQEPPLESYSEGLAVPKFLTHEQQALYRRANAMYNILMAADTTWIDYFDDSRDYNHTYESVEINGQTYYLACGRYADWAEFEAVIHTLFTDDLWQNINSRGGDFNTYENYNGRLCYISAAKGAGYFYNGYNFPDKFELVSMTEDEIVFTLIGHYTEVYSTAGMSREEAAEYMRTVCEYTQEFTIRMVRTEEGWRFDEFHSAATEEIGPTEPGAIPYEPEEEEEFLLPVYSNTMAGGFHDLYAVLEDGRLLMWGEPEFTEGLIGGELGETPIVLMEDVAAVYCGTRGSVAAVDKNGTLWALDVVSRYDALNPNVVNRTSPYEPVWVMDDVAMIDIDFLQTLILKRNGTLLSVRGDEVSTVMEQVTEAWANGYGGYARTVDGTLWNWGIGPEAFDPIVVEEEPDWLKRRYREAWLNGDGSFTAWDVTIPNVVQTSAYWALQEDGTLWNWGDEQHDEIPTPPAPVLDGVKQFTLSESGILVLKQDGSYWYSYSGSFGSYHSIYEPIEFVQVYPRLDLPVYPHTMDAGVENDLYAVLDDGRLVMWGTNYGRLQGGTFEDGPVVLMENVAAVYATGGGSGIGASVVAIDKEGTLWGLDGSLCFFNPEYTWENRDTWEYPVHLIDNVAMIASASFYDYILLRDGTLWHWGVWEGYPGYYNHSWADPDSPGKPAEQSLTKIMDNVIYVACGGNGGWAITADHVLWEWDSSHEIKKAANNITWLSGLWGGDYLTADGTYVDRQFVYDPETHMPTELEPVILKHVAQVEPVFYGSLIVLKDGSLLQRLGYDKELVTRKVMGDVAQVAAFDSRGGALIRKTDGSYWFAKITATSPDKLGPVTAEKVYPVEAGLPAAEHDPKAAFAAVLGGTLGYYDVDAGRIMYLHTDSYSVYFRDDRQLFVADMAVSDLDNDYISEVVLRLNVVVDPHASVSGYKVLHYRDGVIYGYAFDTLTINRLKADGSLAYSNSAEDYGWQTLSFSDQGYKFYPFTYRVPGIAGDGMYYVDGAPASKDEFLKTITQLNQKSDPEWFACDEDGLSAVVRLIK